jgi:hypothetical protein
MRLRGRRPILRPARADRSIALQLSGNRRRRTTQLTRDLPHPTTTSEKDRDLLPLLKGQITPRQRREGGRRHPATLTKPPDTNRRQDTRLRSSIEARHATPDRLPEPDPVLPAPHRRTSAETRPLPQQHETTAALFLGIATPHRRALRRPVESTGWIVGLNDGQDRRAA